MTEDEGSTTQEVRQARIRERLASEGFVRGRDLADEFAVSLMTIHRDLDTLQAQGWLRKVRGGATSVPSAVFHGSVKERMAAQLDIKKALAAAAVEFVAPGQTIMIDDSTTCLHLGRHLPDRTPLTLITISQLLIAQHTGTPGISLFAPGGEYFPAYEAFLGPYAAEGVTQVRADTLFMSTTAITRGRCYHQSHETVQVKRAMLTSASRRILLADHTKFRRDGLFALTSLTEFDVVISDHRLPPADQRDIRASGVNLLIVRAP